MNDSANENKEEKRGYISNTPIANYLRGHKDNSGVRECRISRTASEKKYKVRFLLSSGLSREKPSVSFFEMAVLDAVLTRYANKCVEFSLHGLIEDMFGHKKDIVSPKFKKEVKNAITKLSDLLLTIDITDECKMRKINLEELIANDKSETLKNRIFNSEDLNAVLDESDCEELKSRVPEENSGNEASEEDRVFLCGYFLPLETISEEKNIYQITAPPTLFSYAENISKQVIRYPTALLNAGGEVKDTGQRFLLRYYLIQRICYINYNITTYKMPESEESIVLYDPTKPAAGVVPILFEYEGKYTDFLRTAKFKRKIDSVCRDIENILDSFMKAPELNIISYCKSGDGLKYVVRVKGYSAVGASGGKKP